MTPGGLFIVSAPSGGGKTSLTRALVPRLAQAGISAVISVSCTTRPPRAGEQEGVHYHFVSDARFEEMRSAGEFLEHAEVFGNWYGTGRQRTEALLAAGSDVILDIDWQGARQIKRLAPGATGIFVLPPSTAELERRLRARGQDGDRTIAARMAAARAEMAHHAEYDYLIVNEQFDTALEELATIFVARRLQRPLQVLRHQHLITGLLASADQQG